MENKIIQEYLHLFSIYLRGVRDASEQTINDYQYDVSQYIKYFAEKVDATLQTFCVNEYHVREFSSYLAMRGNKGSTRTRRLNGLIAFWDYLHKQHGHPRAMTLKECGIRIKKNRNRTQSLKSEDYNKLIRGLYAELRQID